MSLADYDALKTSIANWLKRPDLTSAIPDFITLAESRLNKQLRTAWQVTRKTSTLDEVRENLPSDFLEMIALKVTSGTPDVLRQIAMADFPEDTTAGTPTHYAIEGANLRVTPAPAANSPVEMTYYATIPALSASNTTNWLLTRSPALYLYGSLMESAPYLREDARLQTWTAMYAQELDALRKASVRSTHGALRLNARIF